MFSFSDPGFAVLANDPGNGVNAPGEIKFILEMFSPEAGEALAQLDNRIFGLF